MDNPTPEERADNLLRAWNDYQTKEEWLETLKVSEDMRRLRLGVAETLRHCVEIEREACAQLVDGGIGEQRHDWDGSADCALRKAAQGIRARGKEV